MIDHLRRDSKQSPLEEKQQLMSVTSSSYSDLKEVLNEALSHLPEVQRSVILLRDYEGYNYLEIGEITGLSESQVKVYIYRARVFLKEYIGSVNAVI
jgi:RNA polymerase sigma-70 factor (ECF subfamily)